MEIEMEKVITGKVSDADGTALQGVSLLLEAQPPEPLQTGTVLIR